MAVNRYKPHLYVIPEDDANNDIYNGFVQHTSVRSSAIQALRPVGGWVNVLDYFVDNQVPELQTYPQRLLVLLIDFDGQHKTRLPKARKKIPEAYRDRVFILGVFSKPETLKTAMKHASYEKIGNALAEDCATDKSTTWDHALLRHNKPEVVRLRKAVKSFLFT